MRWLLVFAAVGCTASESNPTITYRRDVHWTDPRPLIGVGAGRILVTNNLEDTVSVLDLARVGQPDFGELARVPVGLVPIETEGPHHAAIDPAGLVYYVGISYYVPGTGSGPHGAHGSGTADGYVLKVRAADHVLLGSVRVDPNPGDLITSPDGKTVYATHYDLLRVLKNPTDPEAQRSRLAVIDTATLTRRAMLPLCPAAHGVLPSPDGKRVYAACQSDEVAVVEGDVVTRVNVAPTVGDAASPLYAPYTLAIAPTTGEVFISCLQSGELRVLNPSTLTMTATRTLPVGGKPLFGRFTAKGDRFYVPRQGPDGIVVVDPTGPSIVAQWPVESKHCVAPHGIELTPDERYALLVCEGDHVGPGSLLVVALSVDGVAPGTRLQTVPLGLFPDYLGILRTP